MSALPKGKQVREYKYVRDYEVVYHLQKGWLLYGSPFFDSRVGCPAQAVIRAEEVGYDTDDG